MQKRTHNFPLEKKRFLYLMLRQAEQTSREALIEDFNCCSCFFAAFFDFTHKRYQTNRENKSLLESKIRLIQIFFVLLRATKKQYAQLLSLVSLVSLACENPARIRATKSIGHKKHTKTNNVSYAKKGWYLFYAKKIKQAC